MGAVAGPDVDAEVRVADEGECRFVCAGAAEDDVGAGELDGRAEVEGAGSEQESERMAGFGCGCGGSVECGLECGSVVGAGGGEGGGDGDRGDGDASAHVAGVGEVGDAVALRGGFVDEVAGGTEVGPGGLLGDGGKNEGGEAEREWEASAKHGRP